MTVKELKSYLESYDDDVEVDVFSHYIGYGVKCNVFSSPKLVKYTLPCEAINKAFKAGEEGGKVLEADKDVVLLMDAKSAEELVAGKQRALTEDIVDKIDDLYKIAVVM